jgi:hypothetical protein
VNRASAFAISASQSRTPLSIAPATPITCSSPGSLPRTGQSFSSVTGSTNATFAALSESRYSSASAPKRNDIGTAIAPIW